MNLFKRLPLQIEHDQVAQVAVGETSGMKVDQPVKAGDMLYLMGS